MSDPHAPYTLYKMDISYFSGKLEAYMRYKQIPYTTVTGTAAVLDELYRYTGVKKVPAVRTADNQWLFDTTPTITWFEQQYPHRPATPQDPALAFLAALIEDYADEWLWRPAMWWRWEPLASRKALGWRIALEVKPPGIPPWLFAWFFPHRQRHTWLWGDGMNKSNCNQVRDLYFEELQQLEAALQHSPYLLGQQPSLADFGYFASMFRHFGNDPDSAEIMRRRAPAVYAWTARLWQGAVDVETSSNAVWSDFDANLWQPLLARIGGDYLPYLEQNAAAFAAGKKRFNFSGASIDFPKTVTHHYRVWCLSQLRSKWQALPDTTKTQIQALLTGTRGADILNAEHGVDSGLDELYQIPRPSGNYKANWITALFGQARN
ncbi:MAG: glutathione S-transferase family protein [Oceanococcus sp.]